MPEDGREEIMPLAAEALDVSRRTVVTGRVVVSTRNTIRDVPFETDLSREHVEVERVSVGRFVDEAPPVRTEGDDVIVPVLEEVVVTRLFLKEEVRLHRTRTTRRHREVAQLRVQEAEIVRVPAPSTEGSDRPRSEPVPIHEGENDAQ